MLFSFAIFIVIAMILAKGFEKLHMPSLLGMLFTGILLGSYSKDYFVNEKGLTFLNSFFISDKILDVSSDLRTLGLIIILIRAGLGIDKGILKKIGKIAVKMASLPCLFEGFTVMFATHLILGYSLPISGCLGFILAAVSPAVVVPEMLALKDRGLGKEKEIPTIILAGASIDDVFAITLFTAFLGMAMGNEVNIFNEVLKIPTSILAGLVLGIVVGYLLYLLFKYFHIRDTRKALIFLTTAIMFHHIEEMKLFPIASLLGIMSMGFVILTKDNGLAKRISLKFNKIWVFGEILLFVLIGAAVNIRVIFESGHIGVIIVLIGLIGRLVGVTLALYKSNLNTKEKLFCGISYIPKATVQAATAGIPLAMGIPHGDTILAIGVLAIIITVPIGITGIRLGRDSLLEK
ncbi:cation:proton antiporter [Fusobacterium sp.]|uniref:cation:proton antiporter n=1 Tax=Fusobacterium sp. TaxID=68766 RepID=UPI00262592A5|nr:cation:proton antiporter [Fusobacterium sp.]